MPLILSLKRYANPHLGIMSRPWDKSEYTEYYDLMDQAKRLSNELLQSQDKPTDSPDPLL